MQAVNQLRVLSLNTQSLRNKVSDVLSIIEDLDVDIAFIQESWLKASDGAIFAQIKDHGFSTHTFRKARKSDVGGGVAAIFKPALKVTKAKRRNNFKTLKT